MAKRNSGATTESDESNRREFLKGAAGVAAGMIASPSSQATSSGALPTIALGPHRVTRLIVGSNPLRGYSHFNEQYSRHMVDWFTPERSVKFLLDCEKAGINTYQSSYYPPRLPKLLSQVQEAGGHIQWICLAAADDAMTARVWTPENILAGQLKCAEIVAKLHPVGICHHGDTTAALWRARKIDLIRPFINKVHDLGIPAGVSIHDPAVLQALEEKGWPTDFYMTSFYNMTRQPEDFQKLIGVVPVGETYLSSDPERMCKLIRQVKQPCLGLKVLAAGRRCESAAQVRQAFEFAFHNIKPIDAIIVGMYPRYSDQIGDNVRMVREILA